MVKRDELIKFVYQAIGDDLLKKALIKDDMANGVQFLGKDEVKKVALGVSLNEDFLTEAVKAGAEFCVFHHGFDVRTYKSRYSLAAQKRLKLIIKNDLTIMAFHYALDAQPQFGNNATIIKELGAKITGPLWDEWGFTAEFDRPQNIATLQRRCAELFHHDVLAVLAAPRQVTTIGVVSGGGKPYDLEITDMEQKGIELFISGESAESVPHRMKESEINYFSCGHYATEVFGVQELGKVIKANYKDQLEVEFIDIPNEI